MGWVERVLAWCGAALVLVLMAITAADVFGRNLLGRPIAAATELTEFGLISLCFLMFPLAALRNRHIVADLLDGVGPRWLGILQAALAPLLGTGLFAILAWRLWVLAERSGSYGDVSPVLHLPIRPVLMLASVLSAVAALATLWALARSCNKPK